VSDDDRAPAAFPTNPACPLNEAQVGFLNKAGWNLTMAAMEMQYACELLDQEKTDKNPIDARTYTQVDEAIAWIDVMLQNAADGFRHALVMYSIDLNEFIRATAAADAQAGNIFLNYYRRKPAYFVALFSSVVEGGRMMMSLHRRNPEGMKSRTDAWQAILSRHTSIINVLYRMSGMPTPQNTLFAGHHTWWSKALSEGTRQRDLDAQMPAFAQGGGFHMEVPREHVIYYILQIFSDVPDRDFQTVAPDIVFQGEPAIGDGVFREFIGTTLEAACTAPEYIDSWTFCEGSGTWAPTALRAGQQAGDIHVIYEITGWLMALALRKRIKMPQMVHSFFLPLLVEANRARTTVTIAANNVAFWTLERLEVYDATLARSLASLRTMNDTQLSDLCFSGDVLDASDDNKIKHKPRALPLWHDVDATTIVTHANLEHYIAGRVRFELWGGAKETAWNSILKGFTRVIPTLALVRWGGKTCALRTNSPYRCVACARTRAPI
jgi:hypothetical protein